MLLFHSFAPLLGARVATHNPSSIVISSRSESDLHSCEATLKQLQRKPCFQRGFTAQLEEHRTGIAEVLGLNPVGASEFFSGLYL